jgi:soluble lytic murein transglycosylase
MKEVRARTARAPFGANDDGGSVVRSLFPGARITDTRRPANSRLGRANPRSWHVRSGGAVDIAPIPGMTFNEYVSRIRAAGYPIIESRDEVNNPSSHATGPHWHVVIGQRGS